ncbi:STAS domain-containing protein [Gordonia asplenii]|uniref:STAS domain-containing protein n=1 Tax=Gordonia asplenii TaxID=2725283 RepID=UPI0028A6A486|nr:STAS domain-containing protein [Gordonia asplenii]
MVADVEGVTQATITGSVDAASIDDFTGHLAAACAAGTGRLVLDMSDVDFLGVDGIAALHAAARTVSNSGGAIAVAGGRAVARPLRRTGITRLVPVFDWLPMAFDAVGGTAPA